MQVPEVPQNPPAPLEDLIIAENAEPASARDSPEKMYAAIIAAMRVAKKTGQAVEIYRTVAVRANKKNTKTRYTSVRYVNPDGRVYWRTGGHVCSNAATLGEIITYNHALYQLIDLIMDTKLE